MKRRVMDSKRSWFQKFQSREKTRSTAKKKDSSSLEREDKSPTSEEEKPSTVTRPKAAAAGHSEPLHGAEEEPAGEERVVQRINIMYAYFLLLHLTCSRTPWNYLTLGQRSLTSPSL